MELYSKIDCQSQHDFDISLVIREIGASQRGSEAWNMETEESTVLEAVTRQ
jgi:hypothetical protein